MALGIGAVPLAKLAAARVFGYGLESAGRTPNERLIR